MGTKDGSAVLRVIRKIAHGHSDEQTSDRDLLGRFAEQRDQEAFAALVRRHGAMVMGVGLRVLQQHQDAEDVCQATFLLLAQKARTTAWRDSVASWLYEVAYYLALRARKAAQRRKTHEGKALPKPPPDALAAISARDLQTTLDEELSRLPRKYRASLVLCCLEGKTRDEAARFLGVPLSTVISRLETGRERLRLRLAKRGVPLSLALASLTLLSEAVQAATSAGSIQGLAQAALQALNGELSANVVSANVTALVKGGMQAMFHTKLKIAAGVILLIALGLCSAGVLLQHVSAGPKDDKKIAAPDAAPPKEKPEDEFPAPVLLHGHKGAVAAVSCHRAFKFVATGGADKTTRFWDLKDGKEVARFNQPAAVTCIAFSGDGKSWASACEDGSVSIWMTPIRGKLEGRTLRTFKAHAGAVRALSWVRPDGKTLITGGDDGKVKLWNAFDGKEEPIVVGSHEQPVSGVAYTYAFREEKGQAQPDVRTLRVLSASADKTVKMWDAQAKVELHTFRHTARVAALAVSPDYALVATATEEGKVRVWHAVAERAWQKGKKNALGDLLCECEGLKGAVRALAFSPAPHGGLLAGVDSAGIKVWSAGFLDKEGRFLLRRPAGELTAAFAHPKQAPQTVTFGHWMAIPDGVNVLWSKLYLVSGDAGGTVNVQLLEEYPSKKGPT